MILVVAGPTGAGKTAVGSLLAERLGWRFLDADDFHPPANVAKMRAGIALDDADRAPWLQALRAEIEKAVAAGQDLVLACSALKRAYRQQLAVSPDVLFVFLASPYRLTEQRLRDRRGHFAAPSLLAEQVRIHEPPLPDERAVVVDGTATPPEVVAAIRQRLGI